MHLRDLYAFIFAMLPSIAYSLTIVKKEKKTNLVLLQLNFIVFIFSFLISLSLDGRDKL